MSANICVLNFGIQNAQFEWICVYVYISSTIFRYPTCTMVLQTL